MALTPQKVSTLTDATKPLADSVIAYVVQGVNSRKTTLGDIRRLASYTISSLPAPATAGAGAMAYCTDATGGAVPVYCDGSNWKRFDTNAVVS
jgi:hypothetical protein